MSDNRVQIVVRMYELIQHISSKKSDIDDLQREIDKRQSYIDKYEDEINEFEKELNMLEDEFENILSIEDWYFLYSSLILPLSPNG